MPNRTETVSAFCAGSAVRGGSFSKSFMYPRQVTILRPLIKNQVLIHLSYGGVSTPPENRTPSSPGVNRLLSH